jgi:rRNA maturation endonuclease Nob1
MKDIRLHSNPNAICILCGRIFYGQSYIRCPKCGGMCHVKTDTDLQFMGKSGIREVEKSKS